MPEHGLKVFILSFCLFVVSNKGLAATGQRALLTLKVNQEDKGEVLVYLSGSDILIRVLDLAQAGLKNFSGKRQIIKGEAYVSLASLGPELKYQFDDRALSLDIMAQPGVLGRESVVNLAAGKPAGITYSNDNSAFLNYSVNLNQADFNSLSFFLEGGISFGKNLAYTSVMRNSNEHYVRGLTNLTLDNPEEMTTWTLGDFLSNTPDPIGGSNFLGGVGYATNFGLNPYFIQFPMPTLAGALTTPSTLDIYVNGRFVRQEELPPGKFQLSNIPGIVGAGNTQVVIRDVFGNQSSIGSPYYLATQVLSQGLSDFGYSLGFVRHDLGTESFDYDDPAFIGYDRYGFTSTLTAGIRLEAQHNMVSSGPLLSIALPYGEFDLSGAGSLAQGYFGGALSAAYSYVTQKFSIGAFVTAMSSNYSNTSLEPQSDRQTFSSSFNFGFPIGDLITITPQLLYNVDKDLGTSWWAMLTAYLRISERISIVASGGQSRQAGNGNDTTSSISLVYFFGHDTTATVAWNHQDKGDSGSLMVQKALPVGPGYAYQVQGQTGTPGNQFNGMFQYQTTFGQYLFDYSHIEDQDQTSLTLAGGLVTIGDRLFMTRPVQEGFALIRVPGVDDVSGYVANQYMGKTDRKGDLLVSNLLPYYGNVIGINDKDVPLDYELAATEKTVAIPRRGGAIVNFPPHRLQAFFGKLAVERAGRSVIPRLGSLDLVVNSESFSSPIGNDGAFYLENVPAGLHPATITFSEGECHFNIDFPDTKQTFVKLGTLRC